MNLSGQDHKGVGRLEGLPTPRSAWLRSSGATPLFPSRTDIFANGALVPNGSRSALFAQTDGGSQTKSGSKQRSRPNETGTDLASQNQHSSAPFRKSIEDGSFQSFREGLGLRLRRRLFLGERGAKLGNTAAAPSSPVYTARNGGLSAVRPFFSPSRSY